MISLKEVLKATKQFDKNIVYHTPLEYNHSLSEKYGAEIYLKREDLQLVRSYKIRGAYNFLMSLDEKQKNKGVVAASAGNHAQGLALTCHALNIKGTIFMPQTTPSQKVRKTKKFGNSWVEVRLIGDSFDEAFAKSMEFCKETGAVFVHPFDDPKVITGQATIGLEIIEDFKDGDIDFIIIPIGGGGIISGVGTIFKELSPKTKIIGVESEGSPSMYESVKKGEPICLDCVDTFADGVAVKKPGKNTFNISKDLINDFKIVPDGLTSTAMLGLLDDQGIIVEPAGALSIAALDMMKTKIKGKKVVCIVSGGNFDFSRLPNVKEKSLKYLGLKRYFIISFPQRPGALREFLDLLGENDDIVYFEYIKKTAKERGPALVGIESDSKENFDKIVRGMDKYNIMYDDITHKEMYFDLLV